MKVRYHTMGCKVNQQETAALAQLLESAGYETAALDEKADIYLLNSCTVTAGGDKKGRQWLRACKRENPECITVLTGCMPQAFPEKAQAIPEADIITGAKMRANILTALKEFEENRTRIINIDAYKSGDAFEELPSGQTPGHTRAFVKIQDGCNRFCAYCIIPYARGRARSRSEASILREIEALAASGYKEVVLTGINLTCYGMETGTNIAEIINKVCEIKGIERVRLGSLEPDLLTDEVLTTLAAQPKFCAQFHLALQSGCDETLKRMNRHYTTADFSATVARIKALMPEAQITTDIIVGFPGETDDEFEKTLNFVKASGFLKVHVFPFSSRPGTQAAGMPDHLDGQTKAARAKALQTAADEVRAEVITALLGSEQEVLLEKQISRNLYTAYTKTYIPVAVKTVHFTGGDIVRVPLGEFDGERCLCVEGDSPR